MRQPYLHDLSVVLSAPVQMWSRRDGQAEEDGAQGVYCGDDRVVRKLSLDVVTHSSESVGSQVSGSSGTFRSVLRSPDEGADPVLSLTRRRTTTGTGVSETITVSSASRRIHVMELSLVLVPDATPMERIKAGLPNVEPFTSPDEHLAWTWRDLATHACFTSDATNEVTDGVVRATWRQQIEPGSSVTLGWQLTMSDESAPFVRPTEATLTNPGHPDPHVDRLLATGTADLSALQIAERNVPDRRFAAAGAPWFFTLFGRDSLIAASMASDTNPQLAWDTLRTLAHRQGSKTEVDTAEQPGKILHEVRRAALDLHDAGTVLPPEYYGTIDATLLWVMLLGRLARQGATDTDLAEFLDPLLAALGWLRTHADADGDGFLEYFDESGHGLANQGWKDSGDSIRFADGTLAEGPIVLVEVQGYAFAAARIAADLLPRLGRTDDERAEGAWWDGWADAMAERIRDQFWIEDELGAYLALALDRHKRPVTGVASNMGHLLGLGVLTADEERVIVDRLMHPTMFSGYGIRTMSTTNAAYWPLRYHVGSVWTHDTAWIIEGMLSSGFADEARAVARGLTRAASGFDDRLPELFGGQASDEAFPPVPYPASCRPQAWAAASAFVIARALS